MSTAPRPGWYRDPAGTPAYRWWDGSGWTDQLSDTAQAPAPSAAFRRDEADPTGDVGGDRSSSAGDEAGGRHSPWRRVVALVVILALVGTTGIGVAVLFWGSSEQPSPAGAPAASAPERGGQLEERSRQASIGTATMTLPERPYVVHADPVLMPSVFDALFLAEAVVHANYTEGQDWSAMVCLASVNASLFDEDDLSSGASAALQQLVGKLYGDDPRVEDVRIDDQAADGHPGVMVSARVRYDIDELPSRYDDVSAWFVRLDDGSTVAAVTSVPDDASESVRQQARTALESLTVR